MLVDGRPHVSELASKRRKVGAVREPDKQILHLLIPHCNLLAMTGLTVINLECDGPNACAHHRLFVIVQLDGLVIERESLELIVEEEVHCLLSQLECQALKERDVIVDQLIIAQVELRAPDQLVHESMREDID